MIVVPFAPEHLEPLRDSPTQRHITLGLMDEDYAQALAGVDSWTALDGDRVLGCAGLIPMWPGHVQAWALLAADIGRAGMLFVTRAILRMLALQRGRIQTIVEADFEAGHRWMATLGFRLETPHPMRGWFPDGSAASLYSRINP